MIVDSLKNAKMYEQLGEGLKKALDFMQSKKVKELPVGTHEIDGSNVYALIQSYTTRPASETGWESHKKYIDIQYVLEGCEEIGWMPVDRLRPSAEYDAQKDKISFDETEQWTRLALKAGDFAILYPDDGHKPCCISGKAAGVKKAVIKIKLD